MGWLTPKAKSPLNTSVNFAAPQWPRTAQRSRWLVRRPQESLHDLLARLDEAIGLAVEEDGYADKLSS